MAWYIVSDVVERLLEKLGEWHDDEDHIIHYFGGREKLNQLKETLGMLRPHLVYAEMRIHKNMVEKAAGVAVAVAVAVDHLKERVKMVKGILYEMEDLLEEVDIAKREIQQQDIIGPDDGLSSCLYEVMRPLCSNLASKQEVKLQQNLLQVQKGLTQQFESLMGNLLKTLESMPQQEERGKEAEEAVDILPGLIQCSAYCCLFPRTYEFKKIDLIYLWMAQGFLDMAKPKGIHQAPPLEVGHQYFLAMLAQGAFIETTTNENDDLIGYKLNNDWADKAEEMCRGECLLVDHEHSDLNDIGNCIHELHHVSFIVGSSWEAPEWLLHVKQLRSLLLLARDDSDVGFVSLKSLDQLLSTLTCLRAVDLGRVNFQNLPKSIAGLKHLRYLKSGGLLQSLPESITRLRYLQALDLQACPWLKKIPVTFNRNVRLMFSPKHHKFVVDENNSLDALVGSGEAAVGKFEIFFKRRRPRAVSEASAANLESKPVNDLVFEWSSSYRVHAHADMGKEELVLGKMKPPQSLTCLKIRFWKGTRFPSWGPASYVNLPSLVSIEIEGCNTCKHLPFFSRLPNLKYLRLANLEVLEYVEEETGDAGGYIENELADSAPYFPSLENLNLEELSELKGWSNDIEHKVFPRLSKLHIHLCPRLMSMPWAPHLELLNVEGIQGELLIHSLEGTKDLPEGQWLPSSSGSRDLQIESVAQLNSLSIRQFDFKDTSLKIKRCDELVNLQVDTLSSCKSMQLEVHRCDRLRYICGTLQCIIELKIWSCEELELWDMMDGDVCGGSAAWQYLTKLEILTLGNIRKLESLPIGLCWLQNLKELNIFQLRNLTTLPEWIWDISTFFFLQLLEIADCPNLRTLFSKSLKYARKSVFLSPETFRIERCQGLKDLFGDISIYVKRLEIHRCDRLKHVTGENVELEELVVDDCRDSQLWNNDNAWQYKSGPVYLKLMRISKLESLPQGLAGLKDLHTLDISMLPDLRQLPHWISQLSNLEYLQIQECPKLTTLPDSLCQLTSLEVLIIRQCNPVLKTRCQQTTGEDWPKIQHIRWITVE